MQQILMVWVVVSPFVVAFFLIRKMRKSAWLRQEGIRVPGTILAVTTKRADRRVTSKLTFGFETEDGRAADPVSTTESGYPEFHEGQSITVAYDPKEPGSAEIMELDPRTRTSVTLIVVYAIACAVGTYLFWGDVF